MAAVGLRVLFELRKNMPEHYEVCPRRPQHCPNGCGESRPQSDMEAHQEVCPCVLNLPSRRASSTSEALRFWVPGLGEARWSVVPWLGCRCSWPCKQLCWLSACACGGGRDRPVDTSG